MEFREWFLNEMKMPFGKHKGQSLKDVPAGYLRWLSKQNPDPYLQKEIDDVLKAHESKKKSKEKKYYLAKVINPFSLKGRYKTGGVRFVDKDFDPNETIAIKDMGMEGWLVIPGASATSQTFFHANKEELDGNIKAIRDDEGKAIGNTDLRKLYDDSVKEKYNPEEHGPIVRDYVEKINDYIVSFSEKHGYDTNELNKVIMDFYKEMYFSKDAKSIEDIITSHFNAYSDNPWSGFGFQGKAAHIFGEIKKVLENHRTKKSRIDKERETERRKEAAWEQQGLERCSRCGGMGGSSHWPGFTCFDCGGSGAVPKK